MKTWNRKMVAVSLTLAMVAPLAIACSKGEKADNQTERVLKIALPNNYSTEDYFRQQFTQVFEFANPNIKLEFVPMMAENGGASESGSKRPDPLEKLKEAMQSDNPPDVVMLNYEDLPDVIDSNLLTQLDPLITKDKFDTTDMVPAVIDGIKNAGGGKLYALAPTFSSSALFYNKKIFTDAGVDFPKDGMTWDETFDLAKRVTKGEGENKVSGFDFSTQSQGISFYSLSAYTAPLQLNMFDDSGEKMTVDTDQWEKVWTTIAQQQKENIFPDLGNSQNQRGNVAMTGVAVVSGNNPFDYDNFMSGRLAMAIAGYWQVEQLTNANKNAASYSGYTPIDWDVVTIPSHPEAPGVGGSIYMNGLMGINAKAQNADDAWKFIQFINGDEWAKLKSHSSYNLVARAKYLQPKDGQDFNMEAFYNIIPAPMQNDSKVYRNNPDIYQVQDIGRQQFEEVLKGTKTAREGLKEWQAQGDAKLKQLQDTPNEPPAQLR